MENENAFKNFINADVVKRMSRIFKQFYPAFNCPRFEKNTFLLKDLELKARVLLLSQGLKTELDLEYPQAAFLIQKVLAAKKLKGFELWPISEFISAHGLNDYDLSFETMYLLTEQFTSEFAIRPFLLKDHQRSLKILEKWIEDDNVHIRRWISEGTRPILPWGGKIPAFIHKPQSTIPLLTKLKYDEQLYVRKSVANHLNDISKNHPELVVKLLSQWLKECPSEHKSKIDWIARHAMRSLIKKGNVAALKLMGVSDKCEIKVLGLELSNHKYRLGDVLEFKLKLASSSLKKQKIIVDYLIHYVKANGSSSPKVYKLKSFELKPGEKVSLNKKHSLKKITTMNFYKGEHSLSIQINGKIYEKVSWNFTP